MSVGPVLRAAQDHPELVSQVVEALHSRLQSPNLLSSQQQLDTVRQEGVVVFSLHETLENLLVACIDQSLQDQHERDHVFDFPPGESERRTARVEVMDRVGNGRLVWSDASDLTSVRRIAGSPLGEGRSIKVERVVTSGKNEISDELLVSVDNEVTSERSGFFAVLDKLGCRELAQVATDGLELSKCAVW